MVVNYECLWDKYIYRVAEIVHVLIGHIFAHVYCFVSFIF